MMHRGGNSEVNSSTGNGNVSITLKQVYQLVQSKIGITFTPGSKDSAVDTGFYQLRRYKKGL